MDHPRNGYCPKLVLNRHAAYCSAVCKNHPAAGCEPKCDFSQAPAGGRGDSEPLENRSNPLRLGRSLALPERSRFGFGCGSPRYVICIPSINPESNKSQQNNIADKCNLRQQPEYKRPVGATCFGQCRPAFGYPRKFRFTTRYG